MAPLEMVIPRAPGNHPRRVLLSAFLVVVVLAVGLGAVGVWGIRQTHQHLDAITASTAARIQAVDNARLALLTVQRDNRQALIERDPLRRAALLHQVDADVATLRGTMAQCIAAYGGINGNAQMDELQIVMPAWYASELSYENDLLLNTPAALADAQAQQAGLLGSQDHQAAVILNDLYTVEQHNFLFVRQHAAALTSALVKVLLVAASAALLLLCAVGIIASFLIGRQHTRLTQANSQLTELVEEVQSQHEEIQEQRDTLVTTLAASERGRSEMDAICATVQEGLLLCDRDGAEIYRNPACRRIVGEVGVNYLFVADVPPLHLSTLEGMPLPRARYPLLRALGGEVVAAELLRLHRDDGTELVVQFEATPICDPTGGQTGALGVLRDVTAEYRVSRHGDLLRVLAHVCASALDEDAIAQAAVAALVQGLGVPNCAIALRDPDRPDYARILHHQFGPDVSPAEIAAIYHTMTTALIAPDAPMVSLRVLATGQAHFNISPLPLGDGPAATPLSMHTMAYLPLCVDGVAFGVFNVGYAPHHLATWEAPDQTLLQAAADEIATALHRARLFAEARQLAYTDPLTGLRNHRAMQQALHAALAEAAPHHAPVSVIMLDVDHFRLFNEAHGHDVGDRALQSVARAIQGAIRAQDVAARYGGEEFCVILPGTAPEEAGRVAECVRAAIAASRVPAREVPAGLPLTASLGHATSPQHATTPADLLRAADVALYAAKHQGRNLVVAYEDAGTRTAERQAA